MGELGQDSVGSNLPAKPALGIWGIVAMMLQSLSSEEPRRGKPPVYVATSLVLDGGDGSSREDSEATETLIAYAWMIDLEVVTTDEWAVAATVKVFNCQGQVVFEQAGASPGNAAILKEKKEIRETCLLVGNQLDIGENDWC